MLRYILILFFLFSQTSFAMDPSDFNWDLVIKCVTRKYERKMVCENRLREQINIQKEESKEPNTCTCCDIKPVSYFIPKDYVVSEDLDIRLQGTKYLQELMKAKNSNELFANLSNFSCGQAVNAMMEYIDFSLSKHSSQIILQSPVAYLGGIKCEFSVILQKHSKKDYIIFDKIIKVKKEFKNVKIAYSISDGSLSFFVKKPSDITDKHGR